MNQPARKPRVAGFALFTLFLTAVLLALGLWQLQRRTAKHELIAALTERLAAAPIALPSPAQWAALNPARDEFRRVSFTATYAALPDAMVYSSGSAVRKDASGPGTWAFLPARLPSGETVVIDAGFVENTMQDRGVEDRAVKKLVTGQPVAFTGYLRFPEAAGWLTPTDNRDKRLWFVRDHPAIASALGWGAVAPFYVDLEQPAPENGIPRPGPLDVHLKDDHLQYALTWFLLAGAVLIAFAVWARGRRQS
ncbi:SURF1 family protein [Bradyrhizobium diazoefficiens]|uniref:SURF1 family protein n=1 Tax=Bradyrhizobium centrosematis TaxID=1300039 RepID=UPI001B8A6720|nr:MULTISPECIES: SURF1 family protein [Bradyrhizobium]MBR0702626.1 SURF1 family protein [Bradyrhizobium diazoefficiens]MBR0771381.1 SURF1 family protein [Bradyrhizobium diazoefficiens]MCS3761769.1 cytochrome oxidase assembly protein ShyY1 [Bradyrhizobium centrosematis]MCS3774437.1 cytochrome oxidase assembly protein ShyY1 [Bradyrhizobium centrosematis]